MHDYLREFGGAERVVGALHKIFPQAVIYTAFVDWEALGELGRKTFEGAEVRTTYLQKFPFIKKLFSPLRLISAKAFAKLDLSEFDVVISSSNAYFAKAVKVREGAVHLCYCHTPPRNLYGYETTDIIIKNPLYHKLGQIANFWLRQSDWEMAQEVGVFMANSGTTQKRIKKYYQREAQIVYPPVSLPEIKLKQKREDWFLYVNRLHLAKHPELAVEACLENGWRLKVAGSGPMLNDLKEMTKNHKNGELIEFLGVTSDEELADLYSRAKLLLYPVVNEDFGMIPIEAMSLGTPVVAHASGGPLETITEGKTGVFFKELTAKALAEAVKKAQKKKWSQEILREEAKKYSFSAFEKKITKLVEKNVKK